jgi:hypothetical protein
VRKLQDQVGVAEGNSFKALSLSVLQDEIKGNELAFEMAG